VNSYSVVHKLPSADDNRSKYGKSHTCKGDPLRVNLYREQAREFKFSIGVGPPTRVKAIVQRWRVVSNGVVIGWIGKIPPVDNCLLWMYTDIKLEREWACWYADNRTDKPNISLGQAYCVKKRRQAVERLVKQANAKHLRRLGWANSLWWSFEPPWYKRQDVKRWN